MPRAAAHAPSERVLRACAMFGLDPCRTPTPRPSRPGADLVSRMLDGGASVVLVVGPSGSGKSTLLRLAESALAARRRPVLEPPVLLAGAPRRLPLLDLFALPLHDTIRLLSRVGLAEPALWARPARKLSDGQRFRLSLALAMARARAGTWLLIDEFCSTLDDTTARTVALGLRRWLGASPGTGLICATAHEHAAAPLAPDLVVRLSLDGAARLEASHAR